MGAEGEFLVNECHSMLARIEWRVRLIARRHELHDASVGPHSSREHAHQRALASSILANERVYFAFTNGDVDAIERERRAVSFRDIRDAKDLVHPPVRYLSMGGATMSFVAGRSRLSGVTIVTPVSIFFSTGCLRKC